VNLLICSFKPKLNVLYYLEMRPVCLIVLSLFIMWSIILTQMTMSECNPAMYEVTVVDLSQAVSVKVMCLSTHI